MPQDPMTVLVVSKDFKTLDCFKLVITEIPNLSLAGESSSWMDTLQNAEKVHPDIIWIDARMPGCHQFVEDLKTVVGRSRIMTIDLQQCPQRVVEITGTGTNISYRTPEVDPAINPSFTPPSGPRLISPN